MAAQITITQAQLETLADQGATCIVHDPRFPHGEDQVIEAWVLDESSEGNVHRTILVSMDGTIMSDLVERD